MSTPEAVTAWPEGEDRHAHSSLKTVFPSVVRLNVGGIKYTTALSTLLSKPDSMLCTMFSGRFEVTKDPEGLYFIDRDGTYFRHILNYLRDGVTELPEDRIAQREIMREAEYFQLQELVQYIKSDLYPRVKTQHLALYMMPTENEGPHLLIGPAEYQAVCDISGRTGPAALEVQHSHHRPVNGRCACFPENYNNIVAFGKDGHWFINGHLPLLDILRILERYGWSIRSSATHTAINRSDTSFTEYILTRLAPF
eukprot:tig00000981_g5882.t1